MTIFKRLMMKGRFLKKNLNETNEWNVILDQKVLPVSKFLSFNTLNFNLDSSGFHQFVDHSRLKGYQNLNYIHKKPLEFYISYSLLKPESKDILLDAAGGDTIFIDAVRNISNCKSFLNDHMYNKLFQKNDVTIIGGDVSSIDLPDSSVTKITCHHSFEHFHNDTDIKFIQEIKRLLKPGGEAVILPIFLAKEYYETWSIEKNIKYDQKATTLIDKTASLPGNKNTGYFARIYNEDAFISRILNTADACKLKSILYNCLLDGEPSPDMNLNHGAKINMPMRALFLKNAFI